MNLTDHDILELSALCNAFLDDALDDAQRARLAQMLAASEDARRFYVRFVGLSASLHDYAGETQAEAPDAVHIIEMPAWWQRGAFWWTIGSLAAAAVTVGSLLWFAGNDRVATTVASIKPETETMDTDNSVGQVTSATNYQSTVTSWKPGDESRSGQRLELAKNASVKPETETMDADDSVGQVTGATDCQWIGAAWKPGDELRSGQRLELTKGVVEIAFDSGAQVTLEGPTSLDLNSAWNATLRSGELRANVPKEAIGFRVSNAVVDVVDLGTQFSMNSAFDGVTEVFVNKGKVEAIPHNPTDTEQSSLVLCEEQAREFNRHGHAEVKNSRLKMKWLALANKSAHPLVATTPLRYIHWSFDETDGSIALANAVRFAPGNFDLQLHSLRGSAASEFRTLGRWGQALPLDGETYACATIPDLSDNAPRTIAFWVKVPVKASLTEAGSMASWIARGIGSPQKSATQRIQIGWNTNPATGTIGALRTEIGRDAVVGATPLRDDTWHHIAVLLLPHNALHARLHVKQYVDGHLEGSATQRASKHRHVITAGPADNTLWIGRPPSGRTRFRGEMDELFVAAGALAPQEICQLITANSLETPDNLTKKTP